MIWLATIFILSFETVLTENVCRYSSLADTPLPPIVEHRMPPPGPSGGTSQGPCSPPEYCDPSSCPFSFYTSPYSCDSDCSCVNPCASLKCYGGQVCVVVRGTDNGMRGMCVSPPSADSCPKVFCPSTKCVYGTEVDSDGCPTCDCKHPCKDFGCKKGSTCQMLKLTPGSEELSPKCVSCPSLVNCYKKGVCKAGLKKDSMGCDVCECQDCQCDLSTKTNTSSEAQLPHDQGFSDANILCGGLQCGDYLQLNTSSGCDTCQCAPIPCWDKCGAGEMCQKRYTRDGLMYGLCVSSTPSCLSVNCDPTKCPHGLQVDQNGCVQADCQCKNPCDHLQCPQDSYCQSRVCPEDSSCTPAYCTACPSIQNCNNECPEGRLPDRNGCATCQCKATACQDDSLCIGMHCPYGKEKNQSTGCDICMCASSPCQPSPCGAGVMCRVDVQEERHVAVCLSATTPASVVCPSVSCGDVTCLHGLQRDEDGCVLAACTCVDICENFACGDGMRCVVLDQCAEGNCRDRFLRACVPIDPPKPSLPSTNTSIIFPTTTPNSPLPSTPRPTLPPLTKERESQGCQEPGYCASWCRLGLDSLTGCPVCNCPAVPDLCLNYQCPEGQRCVMTEEDCSGPAGCRDPPMRMCVDIVIEATSSTTPKPLCGTPVCTLPCFLAPASSPDTCSYCSCPLDCETSQCGAGKVCVMVFQANCYSSCSKIPRCIDERPANCFMEKSVGVSCEGGPVKQWFWDQTNNRCDYFFYLGCDGNANRFPSRESCLSACKEATNDCPNNSCPLTCPYGFELNQNDCKTCQCVDPCESTRCPSSSMTCKVHALPCPQDQPNCYPTFVPSCVCQKKVCEVACPYGKVEDGSGCDTCECYDPCQGVSCGTGQLCVIVEHEMCKEGSCSVDVKGECVDAVMKKSMRIIVNASYDIYINNNMGDYNQQLTTALSDLYSVPAKNIYILKHEKGSIITTAEVLIEEQKDLKEVQKDTFSMNLDDQLFMASVLMEEDEVVQGAQMSSSSSNDNIRIILLAVLVPLAVILIISTIFLIIMCKVKHRSSSIGSRPLNSFFSSRSGTLSPFVTQASKDFTPMEEKSVEVDDARRFRSFTDA